MEYDSGWSMSDFEFLSKLQEEAKQIKEIVNKQKNSLPAYFVSKLDAELKQFEELHNRFEEFKQNKPKNKSFVVGQTKAGKSSLCNAIIGKKFFIVASTSETYTGWRLTPSPNSNYTITTSFFTRSPLEKEIHNAAELEKTAKSYTRASFQDENGEPAWNTIKSIELQAPSLEIPILAFTELWDTAGVSEVAMKEKLLLSIRKYFAESTVICVCSLEAGSIELSDYEEILKRFNGDNTKKIIFVFTKLGQAIMSEEAKACDPDVPEEKILDEVNKTIRTGFVEPVKMAYPKAKMVIYDVTKRSYNKFYYHKESLVITQNSTADTVPVWNVEHLQKLIKTEVQENNKVFCEQFHSALLSQANSTLAVIISYFTSNGTLNLLKLKYQEKADIYKERCKRDFQAWIHNGAEIEPHLFEYDKTDTVRLSKDNYAKDLSMYILSFLPEKIQNKILSLCDMYTNQLCQDLIDEVKLQSNYIPKLSEIVGVVSPNSIFGVAVGAEGVIGVIFKALFNILVWKRESVKDMIISSTASHLKSTVLNPALGHIDEHFNDLMEKIDRFLTNSLSNAKETTKILKKEEIYKQLKSRISVIELMQK